MESVSISIDCLSTTPSWTYQIYLSHQLGAVWGGAAAATLFGPAGARHGQKGAPQRSVSNPLLPLLLVELLPAL